MLTFYPDGISRVEALRRLLGPRSPQTWQHWLRREIARSWAAWWQRWVR